MKGLKEEIVDNDEILDIFNKIVEEDLKKDYPIDIKTLEEPLPIYMGENNLKFLKTGFPQTNGRIYLKNGHTYMNILIVLKIIKNIFIV